MKIQEVGGAGSPRRGACMRASIRIHRVLVFSVAAAVSLLAGACSDSNDVTGPSSVAASVDLSGTWSGRFLSVGPTVCGGAGDATATLTQSGNEVRGVFQARGCGIGGAIKGRVSGDNLTGSLEMMGCTGGAISGRFVNGSLTFEIGDFRRELVTGPAEVLPGGRAQLQR